MSTSYQIDRARVREESLFASINSIAHVLHLNAAQRTVFDEAARAFVDYRTVMLPDPSSFTAHSVEEAYERTRARLASAQIALQCLETPVRRLMACLDDEQRATLNAIVAEAARSERERHQYEASLFEVVPDAPAVKH